MSDEKILARLAELEDKVMAHEYFLHAFLQELKGKELVGKDGRGLNLDEIYYAAVRHLQVRHQASALAHLTQLWVYWNLSDPQ